MAGKFLYLPGTRSNQLAHPRTVVNVTPTEDASFVRGRLFDGRVDRIFKFGSGASQYQIQIVGDRILNGNLNTWVTGVPSNFTVAVASGGAITEEVTLVRSGSAAKYSGNAGGSTGELYQDYDVKAGEQIRIDGWLRGDGTISARVQVINLTTGKYLLTGGTWSGTPTDFTTESDTTYRQVAVNFNVETFSAAQVRDMKLRLRLYGTGNGAAYWDDWFMFPTMDFFAIFGHNLNTGWAAGVYDGTPTLIESMTVKRRAFFKQLATVSNRRIHNILLDRPSSLVAEIPQITEVVAGSAVELTRKPGAQAEMTRNELWPRISVVGVNGEIGSLQTADEAHLSPMTIEFEGPRSELDTFLHRIWVHTKGGHEPIVYVPEDQLGDVFIGKLGDVMNARRHLDAVDFYTYSVEFNHLPFGLSF